MKFSLPLVASASLALVACTTTSNKRDLYSPEKARGPWTQKENGLTLAGRYDHASQTSTYVVHRTGLPAEAPAPLPPPPPASLPPPPAQ